MKPSRYLSRSLLCALGVLTFVLVPVRGAQIDPEAITYTLPENIQWQKGSTSDTANLQGHPGNMSRQLCDRSAQSASL